MGVELASHMRLVLCCCRYDGQGYLMLLAVDFVDNVFILLIYHTPGRCLVFQRAYFLHHPSATQLFHLYIMISHTMRAVFHDLARVPEAPLADIQPFRLAAAEQVFGVEGRVPRLDGEVAEHDVGDVGLWGRAVGCAVVGGEEGGGRGGGGGGDCHGGGRGHMPVLGM